MGLTWIEWEHLNTAHVECIRTHNSSSLSWWLISVALLSLHINRSATPTKIQCPPLNSLEKRDSHSLSVKLISYPPDTSKVVILEAIHAYGLLFFLQFSQFTIWCVLVWQISDWFLACQSAVSREIWREMMQNFPGEL